MQRKQLKIIILQTIIPVSDSGYQSMVNSLDKILMGSFIMKGSGCLNHCGVLTIGSPGKSLSEFVD